MAINTSTSRAIFWWSPSCWLRISGSDAANFLQGQFTQDLRVLQQEPAAYGLWLDVKGKVLADSFVLRSPGDGEFWIGSYFSPAAVIRERLESFIIADDVSIEDATTEWSGVSVVGPDAGTMLDALPEGRMFRGRRGRTPNAEWMFTASTTERVRQRLAGMTELTPEDLARLRFDAGIPAVPADIGPGDLPNEGGLEADAISYTKGCYLGQEVMARLKSMGRVRRRLLRVRGSAQDLPALPARLFVRDRHVGELRSVVGDGAGGVGGLAMLSLPNISTGAEFAFAAGANPTLRLVDAIES